MRCEDFTPEAPGELVQISDGWAFVPAPLPPDILPAWGILHAVEHARGALSELVGLARRIQNLNLVLGPLTRREAVLSSRIEGTHTEIEEVLRAQAEPDRDVAEDSDLFEVLNYLRALTRGQDWVDDGRPVNLTFIRGLHEVLLEGVRGQDKHPGAFRTRQVYIGDHVRGLRDARFVPPPPEQVPPLIDNLVQTLNIPSPYGPLIDSAIMHYQFEAIHPFEDGNGRIGRLLVPLYLQAVGVLDRPLLYLSPYFEAHRDDYLDHLLRVSTRGAWDRWIAFFLDAVRIASNDACLRVQRMLDLDARYRELVRGQRSRIIWPALDYVMTNVYVTVGALAVYTKSTYPTARTAIAILEAIGILAPSGRMHGAQEWVAGALLDQVYRS